MPKFSKLSAERLATCDERLQKLFAQVILHVDCTILCGYRGEADQEVSFHDGRSKLHWPNSKHNPTPSLAVDVAPYPINWNDIWRFISFSNYVKGVAQSMGLKVICGADYQSLRDYPHFEIDPD